MNTGQDRQIHMVGGNDENQFKEYAGQNVGNLNRYNDVQNVKNQVIQHAVQILRIQNVVQGNANQNPNGNGTLVAARTKGNSTRHNGNQIRFYNCRGVGIQIQAEEFDLMAAAADLDEIEEFNANCILMANLQQASTSGTPIDKALVYDSDGSVEDSSMEQSGGTVEQHPTNVEETRVLYDSLYNNLAIEVEKVNTVNRKLKETNAELTTELPRFKIKKSFLKLVKKNMTNLKDVIKYLNKQLSKEKSIVSFLLEKKKKLKSDFKIRKDELLDKQIQLEKKIKELDNILVKTGQSIQTIHMLSPKPDSFYHTEQKMALGYQNPFYIKQAQKKQQSLYEGKVLLEKYDPPVVHDSEETLQLAQESRQKMKQLNKEIKPTNYTKINHLSGFFVSQTAKSREELYFSNASKTDNVSKPISIPNEEFSDDTTPSVALDARVQNFELQFLKEAAKFVGDFNSLANETDESLDKYKALELEIKHLLKAVVSQDIMSVVQNKSIIDTSNLQTELERKPPKLGETHALSKPVTSNSIPTPQESKDVKNDKVITPGMFRINPFKTFREEKHVPNKGRASVRTKPITVLQSPIFTKKDVNSDSNGLSSTGIDNTKTRRPQPRSNTKMIGSLLRLRVVATRIKELK
nr:hypothetical protein [Tanacetum cinerariifolium]